MNSKGRSTSFLSVLLFAVAFILLLVATISIPVTRSIYLIKLNFATSAGISGVKATGKVEFGVWGYCVFPVQASAFGISTGATATTCSPAKLGYTFDSQLVKLTGLQDAAHTISTVTSAGLVLHPIACGLAFLALLFALLAACTNSAMLHIITLVAGYLGALIATIAFIVDCALYGILRNKVKVAGVVIGWGNAITLTTIGAVILWAGAIAATSTLRRTKRTY